MKLFNRFKKWLSPSIVYRTGMTTLTLDYSDHYYVFAAENGCLRLIYWPGKELGKPPKFVEVENE